MAANHSLLRARLLEGLVIPACPLPLNASGKWSPRHQRALVRYYHAAGAGGLAVGVHSTQFAIRDPEIGLFQPVLELVAHELEALSNTSGASGAVARLVRIAGICGDTPQAMREAEVALDLGYEAGLLSLTAFRNRTDSEALEHCRQLAAVMPIVGFYLQPAVGGRVFSYRFWREFVELENVVAVKIAPFNRYQTWDVVRAVLEAERRDIALYTGNDDNIIVDLLTPFCMGDARDKSLGQSPRFITGGLLGQWGVWTSQAVKLLEEIKLVRQQPSLASDWLSRNVELTDANAAIFDAANGFAGCIPGIMEVLRRQGLTPSCRCLNPQEVLSSGQAAELDRVAKQYPHLCDDEFVRVHLEQWLA